MIIINPIRYRDAREVMALAKAAGIEIFNILFIFLLCEYILLSLPLGINVGQMNSAKVVLLSFI